MTLSPQVNEMKRWKLLIIMATAIALCAGSLALINRLSSADPIPDDVREAVLRHFLSNQSVAVVGIQPSPDRGEVAEWFYNRITFLKRPPQFSDPDASFMARFRDLKLTVKPCSSGVWRGADLVDIRDGTPVPACFVGYPKRVSEVEYLVSANFHGKGSDGGGTYRLVLDGGKWQIKSKRAGWMH